MARSYGAGALFYGTFQLFFPRRFNEEMAGYFNVSIGHRQHYQEQKDLISLVYYINPLISFRNKIVKQVIARKKNALNLHFSSDYLQMTLLTFCTSFSVPGPSLSIPLFPIYIFHTLFSHSHESGNQVIYKRFSMLPTYFHYIPTTHESCMT